MLLPIWTAYLDIKMLLFPSQRSYQKGWPFVLPQEVRIDLLALEKLWEVLDE